MSNGQDAYAWATGLGRVEIPGTYEIRAVMRQCSSATYHCYTIDPNVASLPVYTKATPVQITLTGTVTKPAPVSMSATVEVPDQSPNTPFTLTGKIPLSAAGVGTTLTTVIIGTMPATSAGIVTIFTKNQDWGTVSGLLNDSGYASASHTAQVQGSGAWSASFGGLPEGWYAVLIYDNTHTLVGMAALHIAK